MDDSSGEILDSLVFFRLGGQSLALPVDSVAEVVPIAWLDRPPQMPPVVEGILNLGGVAVPVLRLDRMLGLGPARFGLDASILIMKGSAGPLGLQVEHVDGVRRAAGFSTAAVEPAQSFNGCIAGQVVEQGATAALLLSWPRLMLEEERVRLADFQARAQARLADLGEAVP